MNKQSTRRQFLLKTTSATIGLSLSRATARSVEKPALLGGNAACRGGFPSWPIFDQSEEKALLDTLQSGIWYRGNGNNVNRFEAAFAQMMGAKFCVGISSGTNALIASLNALGIGAGDEVIVSPYTFTACPNAILMLGALPVFVDTDPETFQIDARKIQAAITERTAAIMPVHLGGNPANIVVMGSLQSFYNPLDDNLNPAHTMFIYMKLPTCIYLSLTALLSAAEETVVTPQVDSVGLFKNGLCVVRCSFAANAVGVYRWDSPPRTVHGTFFVEAAAPVTAQGTLRRMEDLRAVEHPTGSLQNDLGGSEVRVTLEPVDGKPSEEIIGKVWDIPEPELEPRQWNVDSTNDPYGNSRSNASLVSNPRPVPTTGSFLVLETSSPDANAPSVRRHISFSTISQVLVLKAAPIQKPMLEKSVILFSVSQPGAVRLSYLTKGASWIPAYFVDISDPKSLRLQQTVVVKNELMELTETHIELISGFPNVSFGHVDSPLGQFVSLSSFFQQLSAKPGQNSSNSMMQNSVAYNSRRSEAIALPDIQEMGANSEDLHYESIGKRSLALGDTLSLNVSSGETAYERVVEWTVQNVRDAHGQYTRTEPQDDASSPWDAIIFKNPLKFPMTTASAAILEGGKFKGQSLSNWTNPGQRSCLRITKALSLQTNHSETETPGKREQEIWMGGNRYYRTSVKGEATVRNFRSSPIPLLMRVQFSGNLIRTDEQPTDTLLREGVFSVNPRHELEWKLTLPPDTEKKITYEYSVLVRS